MRAEVVLATALTALGVRPAVAQTVHVGKLDVRQIHSRFLDATRTVRIWVPPHLPRRTRCDVLYLNDGQNLFGDGDPESGGGGWRADTTVARLIDEHRIGPLIVVGLDNAGDRAAASTTCRYPIRSRHTRRQRARTVISRSSSTK